MARAIRASYIVALIGLICPAVCTAGEADAVDEKIIRFSHDIPDAMYLSEHAKEKSIP